MARVLERVVRHRVAVVLTLAGVVDVVSGDPAAHGIALVVVAALVAAEQVRERHVDERALAGRRAVLPRVDAARDRSRAQRGHRRDVRTLSWPISVAVAVPGAIAV